MRDFYTCGKPLDPEAAAYVERRADRELYDALIKGDFCHVLSSPQTGKSSLMIRATHRLREYFNAATLDLKAIGTNVSIEQWYDRMLRQIGRELNLDEGWDASIPSAPEATAAARFINALVDGILLKQPGPLAIFVDSVETVRALPFSTHEFFLAIRDCYGRRESSAEFRRLTFCLLGSAAPAELVRDVQAAPFTVGRRIELDDFTETEAAPLARGLKRPDHESRILLAAVLHWTHGQPYLTQRLCQRIAMDGAIRRPGDLAALCEELFLSNQAAASDENLTAVRERLLGSDVDLPSLLTLYEQVLNDRPVLDNEADPLINALRFSGITRVKGGFLQVRNRIYEQVFSREWIAATAPGAGKSGSRRVDAKSIAVLPFVNMSSDPENEYLSDGITEDLITALSQVEGLHVPARTSSFAFKGKNEDIRRIGEQLNVASVLEGSVRKVGPKLRVTVQLIDVATGYHRWSDRYECAIQDVFSIQDEIVRSIVEALKVRLDQSSGAPLVKRQTASSEAYQLYLKGRYCWTQRGNGLKKGNFYFELALLEDPNYALAHTGLADTYNLLGFYGKLPSFEAGAKAKAAASKALELDPKLAEAHSSLGFSKFVFDWDWPAAETEFQTAIELNGRYVLAHNWYARLLSVIEKHDQAIAEDKRAVEIDPLSTYANMHLGWMLVNARRYDEAVRQLKRTLEMNPSGMRARCLLGQAYLFQGKIADAILELQKASTDSNQNEWAVAALGHAQALAGDRAEAEAALVKLTERSEREYVRPTLFAVVHAGLGELDKALAWLKKARLDRDCWMPLVKTDPAYDPLRAGAHFGRLMKNIGPAEPKTAHGI